jgi:hypothetical protein
MNNKFDELTKQMAHSVTRRGALKKFCVGLAGLTLACFGLANKAKAGGCKPAGSSCQHDSQCCSGYCIGLGGWGYPNKGICQ